MDITNILTVVTMVVTIIMGFVSKKSKYVSNNMIPIQNLAIGIIVAIIEFIITKDFSAAIALSGLIAGGVYDIGHNLAKFKKYKAMSEQELSNGKGDE